MKRIGMVAATAALAVAGITAAALAADDYGEGAYGPTPTTDTTTSTSSNTSASTGSETYRYTASMTRKQEVPAPKGVPAGAKGAFTATVVEGSKITIRWKLTFAGLTGKVGAAHIHKGKKGKAGAVILALCGPCKSGQTGSATIAESVNKALENGTAYVNVHTAKNAAGELRGQLTLAKKS
jgi:hypothetical protein